MPRYWELSEALRSQIASGQYQIGDRLPTEDQLLEHFGASRHTVREALRVLTEDGLLSRRPRAGSIVIATTTPSHLEQRVASVQELLNYPARTVRTTLLNAYVRADHELADVLKCPVGATWFQIEALRTIVGSPVPLCHTNIFILPEYAAVIKHRKHELIPVADQIAEVFGVRADATDIEISAGLIAEPVARHLHVPAGGAALNVVRRYANEEGKLFEVTVSVHPANRYTYNFHLKRERTAAERKSSQASRRPVKAS